MPVPMIRHSSLHSLQLHTDYSLTFSEFWDTLRHSTFDLRTVTNFGSTSVFHFQVSNLLNHLLLTDFASSPGCTLHCVLRWWLLFLLSVTKSITLPHLTFDSSTTTLPQKYQAYTLISTHYIGHTGLDWVSSPLGKHYSQSTLGVQLWLPSVSPPLQSHSAGQYPGCFSHPCHISLSPPS